MTERPQFPLGWHLEAVVFQCGDQWAVVRVTIELLILIPASHGASEARQPTETKKKAGDERRLPFHLPSEGAVPGKSLHPNVLVMEFVRRLATDRKIIADQMELFAFVLGLPVAPPLDLLAILK
jgi:hypothetical protein